MGKQLPIQNPRTVIVTGVCQRRIVIAKAVFDSLKAGKLHGASISPLPLYSCYMSFQDPLIPEIRTEGRMTTSISRLNSGKELETIFLVKNLYHSLREFM